VERGGVEEEDRGGGWRGVRMGRGWGGRGGGKGGEGLGSEW